MEARGSDGVDHWQLLRSAAELTDQLVAGGQSLTFGLGVRGQLVQQLPSEAALRWESGMGWQSLLPKDDPGHELLQLYLPLCSAHSRQPMTIGHLGQSLDGFIATSSGESCFVTGPANIVHLHRLRALSDAVIVGVGTVATDNPRLTTRLVTGRNPMRVILDPHRRLKADRTVFRDGAADTIRVSLRTSVPIPSDAAIRELQVGGKAGHLDLSELLAWLHAQGCARILVEGGGVTVSRFLQDGLFDRLHLAVAPLLIGSGRRGLQMPAAGALADRMRLLPQVHRMGDDTLFDCPLRSRPGAEAALPATPKAQTHFLVGSG